MFGLLLDLQDVMGFGGGLDQDTEGASWQVTHCASDLPRKNSAGPGLLAAPTSGSMAEIFGVGSEAGVAVGMGRR